MEPLLTMCEMPLGYKQGDCLKAVPVIGTGADSA